MIFFSKQVAPVMCSHKHFLHYQLVSKMNKSLDLGLQTPALTFGSVRSEIGFFLVCKLTVTTIQCFLFVRFPFVHTDLSPVVVLTLE